MLFNSWEFLVVFLPAVILAIFLARPFGRMSALLVLVAASLIFYVQWEPIFLALLLASILFNYYIGGVIHRRKRIEILAFGISVNIIVLAYFKYRVFFGEMVGLHSASAVMIPLGISFYSFHQISFLCDIWRKNISPRGFAEYVLYVTFFPQLIAGPIVRFTEVIEQFRTKVAFTPRLSNLAVGFAMFAMGVFKKQVLADTFSGFSSPVFSLAEGADKVTLLEAWLGVLSYTLQIYFDFSGYSDMALGLARIFGIRLPINFNSPYKAISIIEFWRRWHISLSRFLRDYLYIPLGGGKRGAARRYFNVAIVMLLGGLWHGSDWTFVLWGGMHGLMLILNHVWRDVCVPRGWRLPGVVSWAVTFLGVLLAWTLFRAESLSGVLNLWMGLTGFGDRLVLHGSYRSSLGEMASVLEALGFQWADATQSSRLFPTATSFAWLALGMFICLGLPNTQAWLRRYRPACSLVYGDLDGRNLLSVFGLRIEWRPTVMWAVVSAALLIGAAFNFGSTSEFIYWQF